MLLDGRFRLDALLGRGGMADVFRATDLNHDRAVAIKILRSDAIDSIGVERFRREIAVTASFTHPHILGLLESGETTGPDGARVLYYVMPLIEGETLRDRLRREDHLPLRDAIRITRELLEALQYAHAHGVIHRDIKPGNILLSGGHAVVADFGIARPVVRETDSDGDDLSLTVSGVAVGTPAYMSPEQALAGATVDTRSDLYAAGCVLYEMLTGRAPFDASTGQAVIARKMSGVFVPASTMRPGLSGVVDDIATRALQADPADRFSTAADFLTALELLGDTASLGSFTAGQTAGLSRAANWRLRTLVPTVAAALVVVLGTFVWARARGSGPPAPTAAPAADPARVAVIPFENLSADTSLAYIANGLTTDLIDVLAQVRALTVVSKNGVVPLLAKGLSVDSLARALRVGSVVTGDVRRLSTGVGVSVRLVDGRTGQQLASSDTSGGIQDLLGVRSAVVQQVAQFLKKRLGEQVRISASRGRASNSEAWQLVERVRSLRDGELSHAWQLVAADRERRFQHADSLALLASRLDRRWPEPLVELCLLRLLQAATEETAGIIGGGSADAGRDAAARLRRDAVHSCDQAVARDPNDASALRTRGAARLALWRIARDATSDSLRIRAEADFRAALDHRPDLALAWNDLSSLLSLSGDFGQAEQAATEALRADEYLANAPEVLARLQFSALGAEHTESAVKWCAEGRRRYPNQQRFFACELTTLGWTGDKPSDVGRAWQVLDDAEKRYSADVLRSGWATRRLFVAAIAARAGMRDSALAIVARVRADSSGASSPATDYGEAHVRAMLGQTDDALRLLARYLNSFPIQRRQVARMPWFKSLRADPRFVAMTDAR
jgi:serine/threonine-protein kinase